MRFKIVGAHREFFQKNGFIEFESLLSHDEISLLTSSADKMLEQRLSGKLDFRSCEEMFRVGHDLWRHDTAFRKCALSYQQFNLAAELFKKPTLHLAFDQLLRTTTLPGFPGRVPASLHQVSSIAPLAGALLFHLSAAPPPSELIPRRPENGMFLSPDLIIPWQLFFELPHQSYLLIVYAPPGARYILQKNDPHTHSLKKLGYAFGDKLQAEHHPLLTYSS